MINYDVDYFTTEEPTRNEIVSVGTTSTVVSEARCKNRERSIISIRNTSDADDKIITVNIGKNNASEGAGIVLKRNESFTDSSETGYKCFQGTITAICSVADGQLSIFER